MNDLILPSLILPPNLEAERKAKLEAAKKKKDKELKILHRWNVTNSRLIFSFYLGCSVIK
jgi:hypothetical protein